MGQELETADIVRRIIVKAWKDDGWKERLKSQDDARQFLHDAGFDFPPYVAAEYRHIKVVECIPGNTTYIVIPPKPTTEMRDDLGLEAGRGNTVLGI